MYTASTMTLLSVHLLVHLQICIYEEPTLITGNTTHLRISHEIR